CMQLPWVVSRKRGFHDSEGPPRRQAQRRVRAPVNFCCAAWLARRFRARGVPTSSRSFRRNPPMRVLLIQTDALNVGYLGCYGNDWVATPNLDRLAAEGIVFDHHYAQTPIYGEDKEARAFARELGIECPDTPSLLPPWRLPEDLLGVYGEDEEE